MPTHTILFLGANPPGTAPIRLDDETRDIRIELERAQYRDDFEIETRLAARPEDFVHELGAVEPTIVHFAGHGSPEGLYLQGEDDTRHLLTTDALRKAFDAAGEGVRLVVLNACYTDEYAELLLEYVDCVVGAAGPILDDAARAFAKGFYGGLGRRASVDRAFKQGLASAAAIENGGRFRDVEQEPRATTNDWGERLRLRPRPGVDPRKLTLVVRSVAASDTRRIDFAVERNRHSTFYRREEILRRLDEWLDAPDGIGWVVVTGAPGMGKSAIISTWLAQRESHGIAVPHHFVRRQVADWDQPEVIAASLAAQIEALFPNQSDPGAKPERRLLELLDRVADELGSTGKLVVTVDGLDETRAEPGENPLPRFLPHVLPRPIRFLCATRPSYPYLDWLEARGLLKKLDLDDPQWASSNASVVEAYWEHAASQHEPPLSTELLAIAIERAEGNVLHAHMLDAALRELPVQERDPGRIPRGLRALVGEVWDRAAATRVVQSGMGLLCAAQEALPLSRLATLLAWDYDETQVFHRAARQLLLEELRSWDGEDAYRPRHEWVRELVAERLGGGTIRRYHGKLSVELATWPPPAAPRLRQYAIHYALTHRIAADDWARVRRLVVDPQYLDLRSKSSDVSALEQELRSASARCADPQLVRCFGDVARALGRESHWIREHATEAAVLVANRLRRLGWSQAELDPIIAGANALRVLHVATRESPALMRSLSGHLAPVNACAISPDGRQIASASADQTLMVWNLESGRALAILRDHTGPVNACAFTIDGCGVVSASADGTLRVWDVERQQCVRRLVGLGPPVNTCALMSDGRRVVSGSAGGIVTIWSLDSGEELQTLAVPNAADVNACIVAGTDTFIIAGCADGTVMRWDLTTGEHRSFVHGGAVTACAATADGRIIVSGGYDGTLKVWDADASAQGPRNQILAHAVDQVRGAAITADGQFVISCSYKALKIWQLDSGREHAALQGHPSWVLACAVSPDSRHLVSASNDRVLRVWDFESASVPTALDCHLEWVLACAVTGDGRRAISASGDHSLKVWDIETGVARSMDAHRGAVNACTVLMDDRRAVSASDDHTLIIWDLDEISPIRVLQGHGGPVWSCAATPDGERVVSTSDDGTLRIWSIQHDESIVITTNTSRLWACAVTPDSRSVVCACQDGTLKRWDLVTRSPLAPLLGHTATAFSCAMVPNTNRIVSGSADGTLKLWDLATARELMTFRGHTDRIYSCAVTSDGRHVVSASEDRTVRLWDIRDASCLLVHRGDAPFAAVAATPAVVIAGDDAGAFWILGRP